MTNTITPLRWYAVLAVVFFGILPAVMVTMLVARGTTPGEGWLLVIGGVPLVICSVILLFRAWGTTDDPELADRLYRRCMAFVAGADVLMLGGNALLKMTS
ncbi:hypothetical protein KZ829_24390 [Actinoplanes hulinensis]|uniref:Uncharacterized protein n=1 Tax=Actinoplanes hulinensis TaxID=1144547 RepID=A0ABS7B765_9ACTN|nr:hypothetical protein [Actinoplanes hulinensis]MBW6436888.1 hypothetical protein [Actinoplanes hulinensis]